MAKRPSGLHTARLRAEVIMKVRCGLITAAQAAERLGVSRKTYYKWEQRGLAALLDGVADQSSGRPAHSSDAQHQDLERKLFRSDDPDRSAEPQAGAKGRALRPEASDDRLRPDEKKMNGSSGR
jgi:transposase